jgi:hypothetical protein
MNIAVYELERDLPVPPYLHGPRSRALALKRMKLQAWQSHVTRFDRHAQQTQNQSQAAGMLRLNPRRAPYRGLSARDRDTSRF